LFDRDEFFDEFLRVFAAFHEEFDGECSALFKVFVVTVVDAAVEEWHDAFVCEELFLDNGISWPVAAGVGGGDERGEDDEDLDFDASPGELVGSVVELWGAGLRLRDWGRRDGLAILVIVGSFDWCSC
jgi:hypothetical protein